MVESRKQLGKVGFDVETGTYWGEVLHLCGSVTFHAESVDELRQLLRGSIPEGQGEPTQTVVHPTELRFEGVVLDLSPTLYYKLNQQALLYGKNLKQYIVDVLKEVVDQTQRPEPI